MQTVHDAGNANLPADISANPNLQRGKDFGAIAPIHSSPAPFARPGRTTDKHVQTRVPNSPSRTHRQSAVEMLLILLLGLSGSLGTSATTSASTSSVNKCFDPTSSYYSACALDEIGKIELDGCFMNEDELADLASCFDDVGRENVVRLSAMQAFNITTLPEGLFEGLTSLEYLGLFDDLTSLPAGIFQGLAALETLDLSNNDLTSLPAGIFQGLPAMESLWLYGNDLTTLPEGLFEDLSSLTLLTLGGNPLECLPVLPSQLEVATSYYGGGPGFWVDWDLDLDGGVCGCSILGVADNVCGEVSCTPGELGYTCETTLAPVSAPTEAPVPAPTEAPVPAPTKAPVPAPTKAPVPAPTKAPVPAPTEAPALPATRAPASATPAPGSAPEPTTAPSPGPEGASDTTPMIAGVVSALVGAVLIGVGLCLRRRRNGRKSKESPQPLASTSRDLEHGLGLEPQAGAGSGTAVILGDGGHPSVQEKGGPLHPPDAHGKAVVQASNDESIVATSTTTAPAPVPATAPAAPTATESESVPAPPASATAPPQQAFPINPEQEKSPGKDSGPVLGSGDVKDSAAEQSWTATMSTVNMSTAEQAELGQFNELVVGAASAIDESTPGDTSSSTSGRRGSRGGIDLGKAVMEAAQNLALHCQIPGVSEAAVVVSTLVTLVSDSRDIKSGGDSNLRKCRSIVRVLERASKVAGKGGETTTAEQRDLIEEVHYAVEDLVELIMTYQSKNKLSKVLMSTSFKRRQDDLEAAIDRAIGRLQFGLQVQVGDDVSAVKEDVVAVKEGMMAESLAGSRKARRARRQRKLDQVEIPEDQVWISDEMLGQGGFGEVFLAEYNTQNAAAKVFHITHDLGKREVLEERPGLQSDPEREKSQRKAFLRELEAMNRLRSPHTVGVYGAITSRPDRLVLVMELLPGGDLRSLLKNSEQPLPVENSRRIIRDICAGMNFLHGKETVHGDLKSANVLLDGAGRAKIGDFGTSRWSQHTNSTGLATHTKGGQNTQISLAWTAPEVLDASGSTYASDVYSFGIVSWEVFSRELPWANLVHPREVYIRVVLKSLRPEFPTDTPADMARMIRACWAGEADARPTFSTVMERIESKGWRE